MPEKARSIVLLKKDVSMTTPKKDSKKEGIMSIREAIRAAKELI